VAAQRSGSYTPPRQDWTVLIVSSLAIGSATGFMSSIGEGVLAAISWTHFVHNPQTHRAGYAVGSGDHRVRRFGAGHGVVVRCAIARG
jgi:hypothetical protein